MAGILRITIRICIYIVLVSEEVVLLYPSCIMFIVMVTCILVTGKNVGSLICIKFNVNYNVQVAS